MEDRIQYTSFSLLPADNWVAAIRGTDSDPFLSVVPVAGDAQLRITVLNAVPPAFDVVQWIEHVATINRRKRREVYVAAFGEFSGFHVQFAKNSDWSRGWILHDEKFALDATYTCHRALRGRDDDVVFQMLASMHHD